MFNRMSFSEQSIESPLTASIDPLSGAPLDISLDNRQPLSQPQARASSESLELEDMPGTVRIAVSNPFSETDTFWSKASLTGSRFQRIEPDDARLEGASAAPPGYVYVIDRDSLKGAPWENTPAAGLPRLISEEEYNNPDFKPIAPDQSLLIPGVKIYDDAGKLPDTFGDVTKIKSDREEVRTTLGDGYIPRFEDGMAGVTAEINAALKQEPRFERLSPSDTRLKGVSAAPPGHVYVIDRDGLKGTPWQNTPAAKLPRLVSNEEYNNPESKPIAPDQSLLIPGVKIYDDAGKLPDTFGDVTKIKSDRQEVRTILGDEKTPRFEDGIAGAFGFLFQQQIFEVADFDAILNLADSADIMMSQSGSSSP